MPYERRMAPSSEDEPVDDPLSAVGSEPLVPILRADAQVDPVALTTWHQALSNTLSVEVPHDLMALWLYPSQGGVALVGPAELAADDMPVPQPSPHLTSEQISGIEKIVLTAGYGSVTCLPIRFGRRDVALLLVADLQPERYGAAERVMLQCVAQRVAPMLGRIARQWVPAESSSSRQQERIAGLLQAVAQANRESASPQRFLAAISRALTPLLPHDHIELLIPNTAADEYFRLGEHPGGPLWSDPSLTISRQHLDIAAIFDNQPELLVADTYEDGRWPRGFLIAAEAGGSDIRAVVGARLGFGGGSVGYLLVGSVGPEIYGDDDVELLALLAGLVSPQVGGFLRVTKPVPLPLPLPVPEPVRAAPEPRDGSAEALFRIAAVLAATSDPAAATRLIAEEGRVLLPFTDLTIALKLTDGDRVVLLQPGERRSLQELPLVPVTGTALARVLRGETPHALSAARAESRLIVPLQVAGKVHGALVFSARAPADLNESSLDTAHRLANIVGAHFELLRRSAMQPRPYVPGRRPPLFGRRAAS
jgi:GAF domain-containing protein